ncbi:hypothetical protein HRR83_001112 [Exophiala dermatitidis]|uniref:Zn(2)-C6 fungal-type domain-containing protein n=1 Tax=Exophiala dermatitidis TaxID=5970 RepID=A0AAN6F2H4_EXODE|nr:hypothetical protein HRR75_001016 [Exophiala dermatitidis]KAJ4525923.1 hypothetical protein HRR74_001116 [Exophiala dermatitidis]KAJ4527130.1 hypothetical protein HRR73_001927 [Exophiala dermatitidis]KAJ4532850.1 hypothetical protein HRR76_007828 [Exophiala dermatitidis]KAJ4538881.1 hypothetical protein HRR77_006803 [Exophiala dermatitidis]
MADDWRDEENESAVELLPDTGPRKRRRKVTDIGDDKAAYPRRRAILACDVCRARRTKCDGQRPACSFCQANNAECRYRKIAGPPPTRLETEIGAIQDRLANIERLLSAAQEKHQHQQPEEQHTASSFGATVAGTLESATPASSHGAHYSRPGRARQQPSESLNYQSPTIQELEQSAFPVMVIKNQSFMSLVGVEYDLAACLARLERSVPLISQPRENGTDPLPQLQSASKVLNAFFEQIHTWYPILDLDFEARYLSVMEGSLHPSSESCLALIVAALGWLSSREGTENHVLYGEQALSMVSSVISDGTVVAVEALVYIAVYYCCLCIPLEAFEYIAVASMKAQSLLTINRNQISDAESEALRRAYWAILLIENELCVQLELFDTGVWNLDESTTLPRVRETWSSPQSTFHFSPNTDIDRTSGIHHEKNVADADAYFLAEIAMRRISHRCPSAVRLTPSRDLVYAPIVASELAYQLEEWFHHLPPSLKFHRHHDVGLQETKATVLFLRTQYYSCMTSIYWPAIHQVIQTGKLEYDLHVGCLKFFDSYYQFLMSVTVCAQHCAVNRWTLLASMFVFTMAAARAIKEPSLASAIPPQLSSSMGLAVESLAASASLSPSLAYLHNLLREHLQWLLTSSPT